MQCPVCSVDLQMMERQGVEIDYCPKCRGVWLDRGELDKILERSASQGAGYPGAAAAPRPAPPAGQQPGYSQGPVYRRDRDDDWDDDYKKRRKKNWLEELFD